jgi:hypothetical protein
MMTSSLIDDLIMTLKQRGLPRVGGIVGCSPAKVQLVAARQKTHLPGLYEEFLLKLGKCKGLEHQGEYYFYPEVLNMKEEAEQYLLGYPELGPYDVDDIPPYGEHFYFILPDDAVVFSTRQGGSFLYMRYSEGDDPPVYHFGDGNYDPPTKVRDHFSEFLRLRLPEILWQM